MDGVQASGFVWDKWIPEKHGSSSLLSCNDNFQIYLDLGIIELKV